MDDMLELVLLGAIGQVIYIAVQEQPSLDTFNISILLLISSFKKALPSNFCPDNDICVSFA